MSIVFKAEYKFDCHNLTNSRNWTKVCLFVSHTVYRPDSARFDLRSTFTYLHQDTLQSESLVCVALDKWTEGRGSSTTLAILIKIHVYTHYGLVGAVKVHWTGKKQNILCKVIIRFNDSFTLAKDRSNVSESSIKRRVLKTDTDRNKQRQTEAERD